MRAQTKAVITLAVDHPELTSRQLGELVENLANTLKGSDGHLDGYSIDTTPRSP